MFPNIFEGQTSKHDQILTKEISLRLHLVAFGRLLVQ